MGRPSNPLKWCHSNSSNNSSINSSSSMLLLPRTINNSNKSISSHLCRCSSQCCNNSRLLLLRHCSSSSKLWATQAWTSSLGTKVKNKLKSVPSNKKPQQHSNRLPFLPRKGSLKQRLQSQRNRKLRSMSRSKPRYRRPPGRIIWRRPSGPSLSNARGNSLPAKKSRKRSRRRWSRKQLVCLTWQKLTGTISARRKCRRCASRQLSRMQLRRNSWETRFWKRIKSSIR